MNTTDKPQTQNDYWSAYNTIHANRPAQATKTRRQSLNGGFLEIATNGQPDTINGVTVTPDEAAAMIL